MPLDWGPGPTRTSADPGAPSTPILPLRQRLPARRLVVGGGSRADYPRLGPGEIALDVLVSARPDVFGTAAQAPFRDRSFDEVRFEWLPVALLGQADVLAEARRLLRPGGHLVIQTSARAARGDLLQRLASAGFTAIDVLQRHSVAAGDYAEIVAGPDA